MTIQQDRRYRRKRGRRMDQSRIDRGVDQPEQRLGRQLRQRGPLHVGVAARRHHADHEPALPCFLAHAVEADRRPRVGGNFVADEADRRAARRAGRASAPSWPIAKLGRRPDHALARLRRQAGAVGVIEHQRHGRLRDARLIGDVGHRRAARMDCPLGARFSFAGRIPQTWARPAFHPALDIAMRILLSH